MKKDMKTEEILTIKKTKKKAIEKELGCEFIRISPDVKDFDEYVETAKRYNHINWSTKN